MSLLMSLPVFMRTVVEFPPAARQNDYGHASYTKWGPVQTDWGFHRLSERAVPRGRCHIDAEVQWVNPWRTEQDRYVLRQLLRLVSADVGVLAEVQVGLP